MTLNLCFKRLAVTLAIAGALVAANIITPTGRTDYWKQAPTTLTSLVAVDSRIISVTFYNSTAGALTVTFQTNDASPLALPLSGSLAANTTVSLNIPAGLLCKAGFSLTAPTGVYYSIVWKAP